MNNEHALTAKELRDRGYKPKYFRYGSFLTFLFSLVGSILLTTMFFSVFPMGIFIVLFVWVGSFIQSINPKSIRFQNKKQHVDIKAHGKEKNICRVAGLLYLFTAAYIVYISNYLATNLN